MGLDSIGMPSFWIDAESGEVRMCAEQFHTWLGDINKQLEAVQGILERSVPASGLVDFPNALSHMKQGRVALCQDIPYRINDGELQFMREFDENPYVFWEPAVQQSIAWAIGQKWQLV